MKTVPLPPLTSPRVTIAICSYNHERFIEQALRSALTQTLACEVLVVDDGSTDGTRALLAAWGDRVRVVLQDNGGQLAAYERAFAESTGDVLVFLDSDDFLDPEAAEQVSGAFGAGVAKVHYRLRVVDEEGVATGAAIPRALASGAVCGDMVRTGVLYASAPGSGNAYRRDVLERLFPLPKDPGDRHGADLFLVFGSVYLGSVVALPEPLGSYRVHTNGAEAAQGLTFGNAEHRDDAWQRFEGRLQRFRDWIVDRLPGEVRLPARFYDFGTRKALFARAVLEGHPARRWRAARAEWPYLAHSVWHQRSYGLGTRLGLLVWMSLVCLLPRRLAFPVARRVCNPASR